MTQLHRYTKVCVTLAVDSGIAIRYIVEHQLCFTPRISFPIPKFSMDERIGRLDYSICSDHCYGIDNQWIYSEICQPISVAHCKGCRSKGVSGECVDFWMNRNYLCIDNNCFVRHYLFYDHSRNGVLYCWTGCVNLSVLPLLGKFRRWYRHLHPHWLVDWSCLVPCCSFSSMAQWNTRRRMQMKSLRMPLQRLDFIFSITWVSARHFRSI